MADTPSEDEKRDEEAFNAVLQRLVSTPHKPHKPKDDSMSASLAIMPSGQQTRCG
jgi:hypothetical protein